MTKEEGERWSSDRVNLKRDKEMIQQAEEVRDRRKEVDTVD